MPTVKGILGQANPLATTLTALYTVPAGKNATCRVIITNRTAMTESFRVSVAPDGAADSLEQYVAYDKGIAGNDAGTTIAFMVGGDDVVRVFASSANLSFTCTGIEQDD
ncbi:MAG: hypothetical protein KAJ55_08945 [Anaerolineales bacterium]|nr:hypothetical protein [Anaerolineales bacterium]